jgi:cell division protein FtsN
LLHLRGISACKENPIFPKITEMENKENRHGRQTGSYETEMIQIVAPPEVHKDEKQGDRHGWQTGSYETAVIQIVAPPDAPQT